MRLLLVEDDYSVASGLIEGLRLAKFSVDHIDNAAPAEFALQHTHYDLAIVDLGLPDFGGMELIRRIRAKSIAIPIIILTASDGLDDRIQGLDCGGDDYLTKPFLLPELLARIRALIRRSQSLTQSSIDFGSLRLNLDQRVAQLAGRNLELTPRELNVLTQLVLAAPKVVNKNRLTDSLSNWNNELTSNAIELYISRLRNKLAGSEVGIRTVRGIGYQLEVI